MKLPNYLLVTFTLSLVSLLSGTTAGSAELWQQPLSQLPKPPDTGTPEGNSEPGTTRPESVCPPTDKPLTAINHGSGSDVTLAEYPTWVFYTPYSRETVSSLEFFLYDETERQTIYKTSIPLGETPGILQLKLPEQPDNALEVNQTYRWYLIAYCSENRDDGPDVEIDGWIYRRPMTAELEAELQNPTILPYLTYIKEGIWYDAVRDIGQIYAVNSQNQAFQNAWEGLLEVLGRSHLFQEPFLTPVGSFTDVKE